MNISRVEALILEQLTASAGVELYGLQMVKASNEALKMGTIYVSLGRLQEKGFVTSRRETDAAQVVPRRLYKITGLGQRTFLAWQAGMQAYDRKFGFTGAAA